MVFGEGRDIWCLEREETYGVWRGKRHMVFGEGERHGELKVGTLSLASSHPAEVSPQTSPGNRSSSHNLQNQRSVLIPSSVLLK